MSPSLCFAFHSTTLSHILPRYFREAVLDTVEYGKAKIRDDPSTRSYVQDLDLGRQAASWERWTLEEGIALLPYLWRYTLLRCSLTSQADKYPLAAFQLLILLKRKQEAVGLAELLTDPAQVTSFVTDPGATAGAIRSGKRKPGTASESG